MARTVFSGTENLENSIRRLQQADDNVFRCYGCFREYNRNGQFYQKDFTTKKNIFKKERLRAASCLRGNNFLRS